jgi:hypothetical protein
MYCTVEGLEKGIFEVGINQTILSILEGRRHLQYMYSRGLRNSELWGWTEKIFQSMLGGKMHLLCRYSRELRDRKFEVGSSKIFQQY